MTYRSDSPWEETDYKPFTPAEYETNWGRVRLQVEDEHREFLARQRKAQRQGHIGGVLVLLLFFVGLPLAAAGIHVLLHL